MPKVSSDRLERASVVFLEAILGILKCKRHCLLYSATVDIEHDILRYVFQNKGQATPDGKFMLYQKNDFARLKLPEYWDYYLDVLGQGVKINFPVKLRSKLCFVQKRYIAKDKKVEKGPFIPREKLFIYVNRSACDQNSV